jgi:hypothetical protein
MDDYENDGKRIKNLAFMITNHSGICLEGLRKTLEAHSHGSNLPNAKSISVKAPTLISSCNKLKKVMT